MSSLPHLHEHHGDFAAFRDVMLETAPGRFGPIWWGIWEQLVRPPASATIVDLGCGPGALLPMLRERLPDARLVGVDTQPAMLAYARTVAAGCRAEIVEADLAAPLPLPDGVADVVTAVHLLHELEYPIPLVDEMWRLVRPGGVLVVYDWVKQPLESYLGGQDPTPTLIQHFREHCLYTPEDLGFLLRRRGFVPRETITRRDGNYALLVVERPA
jgi:SAM-dependent methyltransferase